MYYTGFADEAAKDLAGQIRATKELGWENIECRNIDGVNLHNLSDTDFEKACVQLANAGVKINCFGSAIANWAKKIDDPKEASFEELARAIPRMKKLGTKLIRVMSYAIIEDRPPDNQMEKERFAKMREIVKRLLDAGLTPVHENCMNYGGMGYTYTQRLLDEVPGLKLVFDTGNPVFNPDRQLPKPWPRQSSYEFYQHVKEHIAYVHIKDAIWDEKTQQPTYTYAGDGQGDVRRIVKDLLASGYDGGFSMEPHLAVVFHDTSVTSQSDTMYQSYVEYSRRFMKLVEQVKSELQAKQ